MGNEQSLKGYLHVDQIFMGNTFMNSNRISDREIESHGTGTMAFDAIDERGTEHLTSCANAFSRSGIECIVGEQTRGRVAQNLFQ